MRIVKETVTPASADVIALRGRFDLDVEKARDLLAKCVHVDQAKGIRDTARAAETWLRAKKAGLDAQNAATEIVLRAERRLGELTREMPKASKAEAGRAGGKASRNDGLASKSSALTSLGASKQEASRWEKLAGIPEARFEEQIATVKAKAEKLTTTVVLGTAKPTTKRAHVVVGEPDDPNEWRPEDFIRNVGSQLADWVREWRGHEGNSVRLLKRLRSVLNLEEKCDE